ncbi:MAG: cupin domain-containing protein [Pseudomonadota bacterium]|nr:cupin domain-containing protein [Pseudomonadota bacterium]
MASPPKSGALSSSHDDASLRWGACPEFMPEGCAIAVLHGDPAKANADVFFKIPAGASVPRHWHSSPERMVLVSGRLQVKYDGQDAVSLQPGTYAYGPAKHPHEATCTSSSACVLVIAFELPVDAFPGGPADAGNR